eukprot:scaffold70822_cov92-Phaeocystis_antarctica.AAC.3
MHATNWLVVGGTWVPLPRLTALEWNLLVPMPIDVLIRENVADADPLHSSLDRCEQSAHIFTSTPHRRGQVTLITPFTGLVVVQPTATCPKVEQPPASLRRVVVVYRPVAERF